MSVSYDQILQKMMKEIQEANLQQEQPDKVKEHVRAVKLLGDLILDDDSVTPKMMQSSVVTNQSSFASTSQPQGAETPTPAPKPKQEIDHEEANGESLLDF